MFFHIIPIIMNYFLFCPKNSIEPNFRFVESISEARATVPRPSADSRIPATRSRSPTTAPSPSAWTTKKADARESLAGTFNVTCA